MNGEENVSLPLFSLGFNLYPLNHICFTHLLRLVRELCIGPRSSRGEDWYNINPLPKIIKQGAWYLNECCCVEKYRFIFTLSHMGMVVLLLGGQVIDSKLGAGWIGE